MVTAARLVSKTKRNGASKGQPAKREDWGELSAEMRALPNDQWRIFALELVTGPPGHGRLSRAARVANFAKGSTATNVAKLAWRMAHDDRMIAAVAAESRKYLRGAHPEAVAALLNVVRDKDHRDNLRAAMAIIDRTDPIVGRQQIEVTHRTIDPDFEALEELRALRELGTSREKLLDLFGHNGLDRIEALEAADTSRRADSAKVIEGRVVEPMEAAQ